MQDQKDKQDSLNPSQRDYDDKFNDLVSQPDNQALNDQGDATARDLQSREGDLSAAQRYMQRRDEKQSAKREAESKLWDDPENKYFRPNARTERAVGRFSSWSKRKKSTVTGLVVTAILTAVLSFFALLPFKVPGITSLITREAGQRVEQITEKRAKVILARYLLQRYAPNSSTVITGEGPLATLFASMRTAKFEQKLEAKGLTITRSGDGVKLVHNGKPLGGGQSLKNETAVLRALESEKVTNKILNDVIKEEIPAWRWMKRAKFSKWLRIKYGIPRYGLQNSDKEDSKEKIKDMDTERVKTANAQTSNSVSKMVGCLTGEACEDVDSDSEQSVREEVSVEAEKANDSVTQAASEVEESVAKDGLANLQETTTKQIVSKLGTKSIPIVGWVDLVATINHIVVIEGGKNDFLGKMAAEIKGSQYAWIYGTWSGYGSQTQLGALDTEYVGELSTELDGAEEAQMFNATQGNPDKGVKVEENKKVGSDDVSYVSKVINRYVDSPAGFQLKFVGSPLLEAYYQTIGGGGLLGWLGDGLGTVIGKIGGLLTPEAVEEKLKDVVGAAGTYLIKTVGFDIDTLAKGAELMNNMHIGGVVAFNEYCKEIGCRKLDKTAALEQTRVIAAEREQTRRDNGLLYALFSPDESRSVTTQLATTTPSSVSGTGTTVASLFTSLPVSFASIISPKTQAEPMTTYESIAGIQAYGATAADLNLPLDKNLVDGKECPSYDEENGYDSCKVDNAVTEAMLCELKPKSEECDPETGTTSNSGSGGDIRIASFNVRGASHDGENGTPPWPGRIKTTMKVIADNNFDVVAFQEFEPVQYRYIKNNLPNTQLSDHGKRSDSILWNTERFSLVEKGTWKTVYFGGQIEEPWVKLKFNEGGQEFYVMSVHDPINRGQGDAQTRYDNARKHLAEINKLKSNAPVFLVGDFNSTFTRTAGGGLNLLAYCYLTAGGLENAYDLSVPRQAKCPNPGKQYIDHIYMTPGNTVEGFHEIKRGYGTNGSDHPTIYADISIPGVDSDTAGDWSWPVNEKWWKSNRADFLSSHPTYSGTFTSPYARGVAADIGDPPDGSPVYAMQGGKVVKTNLCGAGDGMIIETQTPQGKLRIAYGHGTNPRFKTGDTVKSGQQILNLGAIGCQVSGGHLHVDMALGDQHICPQDVFIDMGNGKSPDLKALTAKAKSPCGR